MVALIVSSKVGSVKRYNNSLISTFDGFIKVLKSLRKVGQDWEKNNAVFVMKYT